MLHTTYVPEWADAECPTRDMSDKDSRAYYKAHALSGDIRFYLLTQAASLTTDEYHELVCLAGQLADTRKASTRKWIAQDVRRIMSASLTRRGHIGPQEAQRRLGQDMTDAIDYPNSAAA